MEEFVANAPEYTVADEMAARWRHRAYLDQLIDDLRMAGLPE